MAPALTQTGEPPNLADTTCHTPDSTTTTPIIPYDNLKEVNKGRTSQETKKKFQPELLSLTNGDCVSSGLAPPACGWAEGRPIPISSPCRSNMDEKSPLSHSDSGNTCVKSEESAPVPVSSNSNMGLQTCIANITSAASLAKGAEVVAEGNRGEPSNTVSNNQNELLALVGRDFDNVNDIIDTLQRLASNPEFLDAATRDLEPENSAAQNAPSAQSSEDRAVCNLARLSERQLKLERRRLFLLRRLRRVTARGLGMTVSSQLNYLTRHVGAVLEEERSKQVVNEKVEEPIGIEMLHKESMKTMSTSDLISLVRRVEASNNLQRLNDKKSKRLGLPEVLTLPSPLCAELDTVASEMRGAVLAHVSHDSDATESSSGGESCDESETFNSVYSEYKPIRERAFYKYCRKRGWVASKWMWLEAQIADLDYRILQQQKILAHIRKSKGAVQLMEEAQPVKINPPVRDPAHLDMQDPALTCIGTIPPRTVLNGYHPSSNKMEDINSSIHGYSSGQDSKLGCARTLGSQKVKRRRYVKPNVMIWKRGMDGIPNSTNKVKVSPVYCKCVPPLTCILCIKSRTNNGKVSVLSYGNRAVNFSKLGSIVAFSTRSFSEQLAKMDSGYHPVLSRLSEILQGEVYSAALKSVEWRQKNLACKSTSYQRDLSLSSNILFEPLLKKKKKDKEHKRNGRRKHSKEDTKERITLKLNKSLLTDDTLEQEGELKEGKRRKLDTPDPLVNIAQPADEDDVVDCDDDCGSWQVSASGSGNSSPCSSPVPTLSDREGKGGQIETRNSKKQSSHTRQKQNSTSSSYDINNIVIPYSMAAASRVELIQYKDIPTPKWRVEEILPLPSPSKSLTDEDEIEDISDEAITMRHSKCEVEEHKKYIHYYNSLPNAARSSRSRRADSSGTNTPDHPLSPRPSDILEISPAGSPPDTPLAHSIGGSENSTVLTLSLSSLQSSLLKSNPLPSAELEESCSSNSDVSSLKCQQQKTSLSAPSSVASEGSVTSPALRTRRSLSTASTQPSEKPRSSSLSEEHLEGGRISPFPCRNFPLKEKEYEDLVCVNEQCQSVVTLLDETRSGCKDGQSVGTEPSIIPIHHRLNEEGVQFPPGTDDESGRDSPLSELTDSAPEEEGSWKEGASPPGWTISAVDDQLGGFVLTVQKN